jgi:hypothetical protein
MINTVIDICLKDDFLAVNRIASEVYSFGWGVRTDMLPIIEDDEPTGRFEESGMVTYEATMFYGEPTVGAINDLLVSAKRTPTIAEVDSILVGIGVSEEERVITLKKFKVDEIERYDKSPAVNQFYIGDTAMWLDKETRTGLMLRFQAEQAVGNTDTTLWANGVQYPLPLAVAVQMLYALEVYASACYDNTQRHLAAVDSLSTIEEIQSYDYTTGYPDKLKF